MSHVSVGFSDSDLHYHLLWNDQESDSLLSLTIGLYHF